MKPSIYHPTDRPNFSVVDAGDVRYFFSYQTCVAFRTAGFGLVVSENVWSKTTGKHLNYIEEDKKRRIPHDQFLAKLEAVSSTHVLQESF